MAGEDLFAYGENAGGGKTGTAPAFTTTGAAPAGFQQGHWGGDAGQVVYDEYGNPAEGTRMSGAEQDVRRAREKAALAQHRQAYQPGYGGFNAGYIDYHYGQGQARNAMDLQAAAARGEAPSAAEIAGRSAMDQSIAGQLAVAGSARGGAMQQASALRNAARVNAANQSAMTAGIQAGRAAEMAQARDAYGRSSFAYGQNAMGQQGVQLGKTQQQIQSELAQRQLNQQSEQYYNQLAFDTRAQALAADMARSGMAMQGAQSGRAADLADRQQQTNETLGYFQAGTSAAGVPAQYQQPSDERAKLPVERMPTTASRGEPPAWLREAEQERERDEMLGAERTAQMLDDRQRQGEDHHRNTWLSRYLESDGKASQDPLGLPVRRNPYGGDPPEQPKLAAREDPYAKQPEYLGEADDWMVYSDDKTKLAAAWDEGMKAGAQTAIQMSRSNPEALRKSATSKDARTSALARQIAESKRQTYDEGSRAGVAWAKRPAPPVTDSMSSALAQPEPASAPRTPRVVAPEPRRGLVVSTSQTPAVPELAPRQYATLQPSDERTKEDAARRLQAKPYSYKEAYRPGEQDPGEVNFGPMAQEMEKNPLTATAVKKDGEGMRMVDMNKLVKTQSGLIAHLQEQIDELRGGRKARRG